MEEITNTPSLEEPSSENDDSSSLLTSGEIILPSEVISYYENSLTLEVLQTSLLIVILLTILFSGIYDFFK